MIDDIIKKAQDEINTLLVSGNEYNEYFVLWASQAKIYVTQFADCSSEWSLAELHFKEMIDTIENEKNFGEKFLGYVTELNKMLDNIDANLEASQKNVPVKLQA